MKWEPTDKCPAQKANGDGKIVKLGNFKFTYFSAPPSVACTKIKEVSCKRGSVECKTTGEISGPTFPTNLYVKENAADPTKCEIASTAKFGY